jgi:hypothetical protein
MSGDRPPLPHDADKGAFTFLFLFYICIMFVDRDSSVGIATRYGLDAPGIESRCGGGGGFSAPVQTGPGAHPTPYRMGTVLFPAGKSGRDVVLTTHPNLAPKLRI